MKIKKMKNIEMKITMKMRKIKMKVMVKRGKKIRTRKR